MKIKMFFTVIVFACAMGLGIGVMAQDVGKKTDIDIDYSKGEKDAVKFAHKKHATEFKVDGNAITCKQCHHTLTADTAKPDEVKACTSCHVNEGQAQKEHGGKKARFVGTKNGDKFDKKSLIFHANCLDGCHKGVKEKKISSCKTCHAK
jgi:hypothetical protein